MTKKKELRFKTYTQNADLLRKNPLETYKTRRLFLNKSVQSEIRDARGREPGFSPISYTYAFNYRKYDLRFSI